MHSAFGIVGYGLCMAHEDCLYTLLLQPTLCIDTYPPIGEAHPSNYNFSVFDVLHVNSTGLIRQHQDA